jgi:hypothetical protein
MYAKNVSENKPIHKQIVCTDGFTISVQASKNHYCTPRDNKGPYSAVELGFPNRTLPKHFEEYGDGDELDSQVFGYVPVELVNELINQHGGVDFGQIL